MSADDGDGTPGELFAVETVNVDGQVRVSVRGELDIATSDSFEQAIDLAVGQRCGLVIDLREATFVGACALKAIVSASNRLPPDSSVTVRPGGPLQRQMLTITGLDALVTIVD